MNLGTTTKTAITLAFIACAPTAASLTIPLDGADSLDLLVTGILDDPNASSVGPPLAPADNDVGGGIVISFDAGAALGRFVSALFWVGPIVILVSLWLFGMLDLTFTSPKPGKSVRVIIDLRRFPWRDKPKRRP